MLRSSLVPNACITFSSNTSAVATTTFNAAANLWETTVPYNVSGNVFLAGLTFPVPVGGLPGGTSVKWSGNFISNVDRLAATWKWAAGVYKSFNAADYNELGVKPVDSGTIYCINSANGVKYKNTDKAGTPEIYKSCLASSYMGTAMSGPTSCIVACDPPLAAGSALTPTVTKTATLPASTPSKTTTVSKTQPTTKAAAAAADKYFAQLNVKQTSKIPPKPTASKAPFAPSLRAASMVQLAVGKK